MPPIESKQVKATFGKGVLKGDSNFFEYKKQSFRRILGFKLFPQSILKIHHGVIHAIGGTKFTREQTWALVAGQPLHG